MRSALLKRRALFFGGGERRTSNCGWRGHSAGCVCVVAIRQVSHNKAVGSADTGPHCALTRELLYRKENAIGQRAIIFIGQFLFFSQRLRSLRATIFDDQGAPNRLLQGAQRGEGGVLWGRRRILRCLPPISFEPAVQAPVVNVAPAGAQEAALAIFF